MKCKCGNEAKYKDTWCDNEYFCSDDCFIDHAIDAHLHDWLNSRADEIHEEMADDLLELIED